MGVRQWGQPVTTAGDIVDAGGVLQTAIDTLAELNAIVADATIVETTDARLSDARQLAAGADKTKLDGIAANAQVNATVATDGSVWFTAGGSGAPSGDNADLFWDDANNRLGIGTPTPNAPLEIAGTPATAGGFPGGILHVRNPVAGANQNAVITGHNSDGGNKQLWYLGSFSGGDDNIAFINRQNADIFFSTNNTVRMRILASGIVGIGGTPRASAILQTDSTTRGNLGVRWTAAQETTNVAALVSADEGLSWFNTTTKQFVGWNGSAAVILG